MKARVLIVDDEADFLQLLEFNLLRQGFDVCRAANAIEALHKARCEAPDVIVLDLMLPDLDGFAVCEILRAQPSTSDLPIIILSALQEPAAHDRLAKVNVWQYFVKGVDFKVLSTCVGAAFQLHQAGLTRRLAKEENLEADSAEEVGEEG